MSAEDEKRLTARQPFDQVIQFERNRFFTGENTPVYGIGQALDISPLGIGIRTDSPLQLKEIIRVFMPVQALDIPLPVFSEVRWVKPVNSNYRVGLQFQR